MSGLMDLLKLVYILLAIILSKFTRLFFIQIQHYLKHWWLFIALKIVHYLCYCTNPAIVIINAIISASAKNSISDFNFSVMLLLHMLESKKLLKLAPKHLSYVWKEKSLRKLVWWPSWELWRFLILKNIHNKKHVCILKKYIGKF